MHNAATEDPSVCISDLLHLSGTSKNTQIFILERI